MDYTYKIREFSIHIENKAYKMDRHPTPEGIIYSIEDYHQHKTFNGSYLQSENEVYIWQTEHIESIES